MKKVIFAAFFAAFAICSCQKDNTIDSPAQKTETLTFELPAPDPATKAASNAAGKVTWQEGDQIAVYNYVNGTPGESTKKVYTLISGAGTASGVFEGEAFATGKATLAFYPESMAKSFQGSAKNRLVYHINGTLTPASLDEDQTIPALMAAYIKEGQTTTFEHVGAVLKLSFKDIPGEASKIMIGQSSDAAKANLAAYDIIGDRFFGITGLKGAGGKGVGNTAASTSNAAWLNMSIEIPASFDRSKVGYFYFPISISSAVATRDFFVAFYSKDSEGKYTMISNTKREFSSAKLKAGNMVVKPTVSAVVSE